MPILFFFNHFILDASVFKFEWIIQEIHLL